jgi:hypothetical protein
MTSGFPAHISGTGMLMCACGSMPPGTTILPRASIVRPPPDSVPGQPSAAIFFALHPDVHVRDALRRHDLPTCDHEIEHGAPPRMPRPAAPARRRGTREVSRSRAARKHPRAPP